MRTPDLDPAPHANQPRRRSSTHAAERRMTRAFRAIARRVALGAALVCTLALRADAAGPTVIAEFAVHAGSHERLNEPVAASLQGVRLRLEEGALQLYEITGGREVAVPSQIEAGSPSRLLWVLDGRTGPGLVRTYELRPVREENPRGRGIRVGVLDEGEQLRVQIGDRPVLEYRYAVQGVPEGVDERYRRSGYIHPLWSPQGQVITRIQPPDHYHHYGIWNPWTRTEFRGREVDFWNLAKGQGTVRAEQIIERRAGPVAGGFRALHSHVDLSGPGGESIALQEQWDVRVWNVDPDRLVWLIDFASVLSPASDQPLTIKDYRYQGFSLRATERWDDRTATLLTSEGRDKRDANATRARWVDVNGVSDAAAGTSGVLFMTHPSNYNFPELLRIWPVGANEGVENVYVNFNPAQDRDWELRPGQTYTLAYRMVVYDGRLEPEVAERYWRNYANPPRVEVYPTGNLAGASVLVYTKNGTGYVHDNIPYGVEAIRKLGQQYGFAVTASDDPALFTDQNLKQYDAIVFANTNNEAFDNDHQRTALQAYVRRGGGFVGIHSASGSERKWPWFSRLLGGNFLRHPPRQDFTVAVVDRAHPSTSFLPDRWDIEDDECYYLKELNPGIRVLLAADLTTVADPQADQFPGDLFSDRFPVAWFQEFEGGRQWYTSLGHRPEHYDDSRFLRHVLGGIQWVVTGVSR
jgi:type 1 glutamine amidotransferase